MRNQCALSARASERRAMSRARTSRSKNAGPIINLPHCWRWRAHWVGAPPPRRVMRTTGGPPSALAAQAATTTIPIVFNIADDPVSHGLVASLARPGGNLTGVNFLSAELTGERLEMLRAPVANAARVAR